MERIKEAFKQDNNPNNPSTKLEIVNSYKTGLCHRTHAHEQVIYTEIEGNNVKLRLISICVLILWVNGGQYKIDMHLSEICGYPDGVSRKNFENLGTIFTNPNMQEAYRVMNDGTLKWPIISETDFLAPILEIEPPVKIFDTDCNNNRVTNSSTFKNCKVDDLDTTVCDSNIVTNDFCLGKTKTNENLPGDFLGDCDLTSVDFTKGNKHINVTGCIEKEILELDSSEMNPIPKKRKKPKSKKGKSKKPKRKKKRPTPKKVFDASIARSFLYSRWLEAAV